MVLPLKIPRRSRSCKVTGARFEPGMEIVSLLSDQWERSDYAATSEIPNQPHKCQWRTHIPLKPHKLSGEDAWEELLDILRSNEVELHYPTALFLTRKKMLHEVEEVDGHCLFELPETGETFAIEKKILSKEELQQVQDRLDAKLVE